MIHRQDLFAMTAAVGLIALPVLAFAQGSAGTSTQPQTTQTTPQQGPLSSTAGAAAGANAGSATTQAIPGANAGSRPAGTSGAPPQASPSAPPAAPAGATQPAVPAQGGAAGTGPSVGPRSDATPSITPNATAALEVDGGTLRQGRRASKVIGSSVYNDANESIGEVDDILVGATGAPVAIISVGGVLGIGAKLVAVPYGRLHLNTERNRYVLTGTTREGLTALPAFNYTTSRI